MQESDCKSWSDDEDNMDEGTIVHSLACTLYNTNIIGNAMVSCLGQVVVVVCHMNRDEYLF